MTAIPPAPALYTGTVTHRRFGDVPYRFSYRVPSLLLDIDGIDAAVRGLRLLSRNRFNLFGFHDRDHGPGDGSPLRPWIDGVLAEAGVALAGGRVLLLCMPRVLGYGFNPLSLWYCYHADGSLRAVLCEVRNTFGERHGYLLHGQGRPMASPVRDQAGKVFHVSPFFPVAGHYRFRLAPPGASFTTAVGYHQGGRTRLAAVQQGRRRPLRDRELLRAAWRYPFAGRAVMAAIHWQALKIWLRGGQLHRKPTRPREDIS
ncbi:DUF1365 domain-containing protein [Aquisalimonas lutea]|uniref:DUF1365 domain-containing protein n=1 Tax=Aquisalimonas lutea TaxID=1327750 RepID=UPI0025B5202C|nr:DUF1365 domain-containing protein [Aquisalimonas lutea]MDN3516151.1 DUF1365 domain-containing protein [Aquisalimonas lutea]